MNYIVLNSYERAPATAIDTAYLSVDNWNDYSFVTMFYLTVFDSSGTKHDIGNVKIAYKGQTTETKTYSTLGNAFSLLTDQYFSLGTDTEYYKNLNKLSAELKNSLLSALQDIVYKPEKLKEIEDEEVLNTSLIFPVKSWPKQ